MIVSSTVSGEIKICYINLVKISENNWYQRLADILLYCSLGGDYFTLVEGFIFVTEPITTTFIELQVHKIFTKKSGYTKLKTHGHNFRSCMA